MNCEDFNKIIDELADHKPMQASIREAGVSHVALCAACAGKLANARAVGSCLLLAASAESEDTPVRVKEDLLAAFADRQQTEATTARVVDLASRRRPRLWTAAAAVAAVAAVIVLAAIVSIWKEASAPYSPTTPNVAVADQAPFTPIPQGSDYYKSVAPPTSYLPRRTAKTSSSRPRMLRHQTPDAGSQNQAYENVAQNTGEFVPLTYLATATAMDSGTVVRVELSRSALATLGFPVNVEGSSDSVKADVILGDDGVARAIRLVE